MALRSGVTDSIEQHIAKVNEPGWPLGLGIELNECRVCNPTLKRRSAKAGVVWDEGRNSDEAG
ncbi:MAG TPA: hypothetical protein VF074_10195 [Pyrinomonadaceae bacterium]